jgi:hypothetical protein
VLAGGVYIVQAAFEPAAGVGGCAIASTKGKGIRRIRSISSAAAAICGAKARAASTKRCGATAVTAPSDQGH